MITFTNLAGFWALLGIPVVIAIHFLQRQAQILEVSTLFLLDALDKESVEGRKFDRIRNSIPLWLQLLAVLLLTWVLVQPRWMRENSVQKIALVLDSSASMRAFSEPLAKTVRTTVPELDRGAQTVELIALDSHLDGQPIYNGTSIDELIEALTEWNPHRGAHDPGPALRVGRSLAGPKGIVIFATDHIVENPGYDAKVLAVGDPVPNVGFAGVEVDTTTTPASWKALIRNYSDSPQSREWILQSGEKRTAPRSIELNAGETRTLTGRFPENVAKITLRLSPDIFDQDNNLPMIVPRPKKLSVAKFSNKALDPLMKNIIGSFENVTPPDAESGTIDFALTYYNPITPAEPDPVSIVFLSQDQPGRYFLQGPIVTSNHPLVEGLNWQGLIARSSPGMPLYNGDTVLLWQGDRPLIYLRETGDLRQLIYNFDIPSSNAEKLPAFIVLTHRFVETIRNQKIAESSSNHELNERITIAYDRNEDAGDITLISDTQSLVVPRNQIRTMRAPAEPGFFEVKQGSETLLTGAAHFVDTREADFTNAAAENELSGLNDSSTVTEHTRKDDTWQIWISLLLVAVLLSWFFINRKNSAEPKMAKA